MNNKHDKFIFYSHCEIVGGARRGAIYDFKNKKIYSIDSCALRMLSDLKEGKNIAEACEKHENITVAEAVAFLNEMEEMSIGYFGDPSTNPIKQEDVSRDEAVVQFMWLELTYECNLMCKHCYNICGGGNAHEVMCSEETWISVLSQGHALGCRRVQFTGGEPFFAKERLKRLIAYARNLGYEFIEVYTNATLIDDEMINFLAQEKVSCAISFYSHDKTIHDNITGVAGSQERTVETTQKLLAKEITIRAAIILSELNKQDLRDSIEYLQKTIGVPKVTWDYVRPIGRGANDFKAEEPHLTQEHEMRFNGIDADTFKQRKQGNACLNHHLCVSPDGNVYPCIMGKDVLMGNVLDQTLQEIVSSDKACDIWGCSKDRVSGCDMCEYRYACFDCRPKVFAMTNDLYAKPSDCLYDPYTGRWEEGKTQKRKETVC